MLYFAEYCYVSVLCGEVWGGTGVHGEGGEGEGEACGDVREEGDDIEEDGEGGGGEESVAGGSGVREGEGEGEDQGGVGGDGWGEE